MTDSADNRPPYRAAAGLFGAVFILYYLTLSPTTGMWDASEYISSARVLGIPHPPGNPLFTLMAHVWGLLPLAAEYAKRINIFAAVTSSASAALWFLVAERWLRNILDEQLPRVICAAAGIFASATAWTVWNQSTVSEKVYTVSMLTISLVAWLAVRWADLPQGRHRDRYLIAAVYILALSSTNHTMGVLGAPVLLVYVLFTDWRVLTRPAVLASFVGAALVGVSLNYLYMPLRAAQYPAINEGEPVGFFSPALMATLGRTQYLKPPLLPRQPYRGEGDVIDNIGHFGAQLWMYWHYWSWQWGKDLASGLTALSTGIFTALGIGGLWTLLRRDKRAGITAFLLLGTLTVMLIVYLNFKFAYTYHAADSSITRDLREVRDRDYFFIASFAFFGVLLAAGFAALTAGIRDWLKRDHREPLLRFAVVPACVIALIPLFGNSVSAPRNKETIVRDYAIDMLQSVEPYGILITAGDNDTFPLWYAQQVLGVRRDITLANLSLLGTDWHPRQIARLVTPVFDPTTSPDIWRHPTDAGTHPLYGSDSSWLHPTTPPFAESIAQLDAIPELSSVAPNSVMEAPGLTIRFGDTVLTRTDFATALLIRDNLGKRPIYFAESDADYPDVTLGLSAHLVTQGLVRKVVADSVAVGGPIADSQYLGLVDVPRTTALLFGVYHVGTITRERRGGWYDPPSADIFSEYLRVYAAYSTVLQQRGDSVHAASAVSIAQKIQRAVTGR